MPFSRLTRRSLLKGISGGLAGGLLHCKSSRSRPQIAAVVTEYRRFSHAQHIVDSGEVFSLLIRRTQGPARLAKFFNPLVHSIEKMFLTGVATNPIERTLLTTGLTAAGVESLRQGQRLLETPHLAVCYQPPPGSLLHLNLENQRGRSFGGGGPGRRGSGRDRW